MPRYVGGTGVWLDLGHLEGLSLGSPVLDTSPFPTMEGCLLDMFVVDLPLCLSEGWASPKWANVVV